METSLMFLLWAITLTGGFWAARGLISARAHRKEIIVRASFTGSGELALYLTSGFILAYAWFQLLSALIAPWFLPHPSGFTSPSQSQYDALIRLPVFFNLLWLLAALALVISGWAVILNTLAGRHPLTPWQRFVVLGAMISFMQQLFTLPQRLLVYYLLPSMDSLSPIAPSTQIIAANALMAIVLLALLLLARNRATL